MGIVPGLCLLPWRHADAAALDELEAIARIPQRRRLVEAAEVDRLVVAQVAREEGVGVIVLRVEHLGSRGRGDHQLGADPAIAVESRPAKYRAEKAARPRRRPL